VFGTELSRVVINEAYSNKVVPPDPTQPTSVFVWAELYNPLNSDSTLRDNGTAKLQTQPNGGFAAYKVILCQPDPNDNTMTPEKDIRNPANPAGTPQQKFICPKLGGGDAVVNDFRGPMGVDKIDPSGGADQNTGYYVLGPTNGQGANVTPTLASGGMQYQVPSGQAVNPPTIVLQRLACPNLPEQNNPVLNDPTQPYNPFITVDFMKEVPVDGAALTASTGRDQPYGDAKRQAQTSNAMPPPQPPINTFFKVNSQVTANTAFKWLVHLDRPLRSPMELLHVSAFKPAELTQQFNNPINSKGVRNLGDYGHRVPWFDETAGVLTTNGETTPRDSYRLYRLFEFLETRSRASGLGIEVITGDPTVTQLRLPKITGDPNNDQTVNLPANAAKGYFTHGLRGTGVGWNIQIGTVLTIVQVSKDANGNIVKTISENVRVIGVTATSFTARFLKDHTSTAPDDTYQIQLSATGDRIAGKINLNTVWDEETAQALGDPNGTTNDFKDTDVVKMFNALSGTPGPLGVVDPTMGDSVGLRTPRIKVPGTPNQYFVRGTPGPTDSDRTVTVGTASLTYTLNRPWRGLAPGYVPTTPQLMQADQQYPQGINVNDTFFAAKDGTVSNQRQFEVPTANGAGVIPPYQAYEAMAKIFNNVTTRSNSFAVWLTVGFFEVTSKPGVNPPQLGAEIGRAENRQVRHRMFAIVDRTNLLTQQYTNPNPAAPATLASTLGTLSPVLPSASVGRLGNDVTAGQNQTAGILDPVLPRAGALNGSTTVTTVPAGSPTPALTWHMNWEIGAYPNAAATSTRGTVLLIGSTGGPNGPNEELVVVSQTSGTSAFTATFTKDHKAGESIVVLYQPGNPGPQPRFDYRNNTAVVPYVSVIK
jgi:hypothetical protein